MIIKSVFKRPDGFTLLENRGCYLDQRYDEMFERAPLIEDPENDEQDNRDESRKIIDITPYLNKE